MSKCTRKQGPSQSPASIQHHGNGRVGNGRVPPKRKFAPRLRELLEDLDDDDEEDHEPGHVRPRSSTDFRERANDEKVEPDDVDGDSDESFLVGESSTDSEGDDSTRGANDGVHDQNPGNWLQSEAYRLSSRKGSDALPGNYRRAVPQWMLFYFATVEMAVVFAQVLYWFGLSEQGNRLAPRKENGHTVVDKTYRQLADELGIRNERRVENCLKFFKKEGLLDYRTTGIGKGRTTRIWLIPEGILKAYHIGCRRVEEARER